MRKVQYTTKNPDAMDDVDGGSASAHGVGDDGDDVNDVLDKRKLSRRPHAQEEDKKIRENQDKRVRKPR